MAGAGGTSPLPLEGCQDVPAGAAGPEHTSEAQQDFAVEPELLNCSRCFAATQQYVIKTQLAILIRLSI